MVKVEVAAHSLAVVMVMISAVDGHGLGSRPPGPGPQPAADTAADRGGGDGREPPASVAATSVIATPRPPLTGATATGTASLLFSLPSLVFASCLFGKFRTTHSTKTMAPQATMPEDAPFEPAAASAPRPASTEEEGPDATYDQFLLNLLIKGPPPKVKADDDDASSDDGEELDIDTLMQADAEEDQGQGENQSDSEDDDVPSHRYLDVLMLQDILAKAHLDIDACMLRDILATEDFADLVYGDKTKNAAGEVDLTPLLDVMSTEEWSQIIRDRMSPDTAPKDGAAEVAAIWAEILAGPKQAVAGGPPPSWFNTVCAWFSEPRLPDDMEAPGAVPTVEVREDDGGPRWFARPRASAAPTAVPVAGAGDGAAAIPEKKKEDEEEETAAEDTVSECSRNIV